MEDESHVVPWLICLLRWTHRQDRCLEHAVRSANGLFV